jgi:hypothetical protein
MSHLVETTPSPLVTSDSRGADRAADSGTKPASTPLFT